MTTAIFFVPSESIVGFSIVGHAEYASAGEDIVCSAISSIAQATICGLTDVLQIPAQYDISEGQLHCTLPAIQTLTLAQRLGADTLLRTLKLSLEQIAIQYPAHLVVREREE